MALHGRSSVSSTAQFLLTVISFGASLSRGSVPAFTKNLGKACAHSFFVTSASCGRRAILHRRPLPPTCGFMTSARIASPCFPRPKFELNSPRAFHKSPPNEFDRHDPSGRGSLVHASRCSQRSPVVVTLCTDDHHA